MQCLGLCNSLKRNKSTFKCFLVCLKVYYLDGFVGYFNFFLVFADLKLARSDFEKFDLIFKSSIHVEVQGAG